MENEKKVYEEPAVTLVKFDFSDRIAASGCEWLNDEPENPCQPAFNTI